ncbi:hypothetical protein [Nannocystis radixulma]|uniref:Uncharacterized protein n=1 Tax=Nannocystis radixulma TaxID=2995305 RepID=A0ABT5B590_9BACT|nr:hypothetical protein [Nannocystis radixulma]MDC0668669.1 hypothetical protein [Nannocystis radixulma]
MIKVIAPIALDALVKAAANLAESTGAPVYVVDDTAITPSEQMFENLSRAASSRWSSHFNYFYRGNASRCPVGDGSHTTRAINSGSDLLVYDESQGEMPDVDGFLKALFKDTALSDMSAIALADNINELLKDQWSEISLDWQPLEKTYADLVDNNGDVVNIDVLLFTACADDVNGNIAGLVFFMFTFYPNPKS